MKLASHYLESIEGVGIYAIIALIIFLLFFLGIFLHTISIPKEDIREFSNLPLEDDDSRDNILE